MTKKPKPQMMVPFRKDNGNMSDYGSYDYLGDTEDRRFHWKENYEFRATLTFQRCTRGRSAANFLFKDEAGIEYSFFLSEFAKLQDEYYRRCMDAFQGIPSDLEA